MTITYDLNVLGFHCDRTHMHILTKRKGEK